MKKLLYQFDTDEHPSVFDNVVCNDGGADHVIGYGGVHPHNVGAMVDGAIFTRAPKDKKNTAIFIGGSNMAEGEALFKAVIQDGVLGGCELGGHVDPFSCGLFAWGIALLPYGLLQRLLAGRF